MRFLIRVEIGHMPSLEDGSPREHFQLRQALHQHEVLMDHANAKLIESFGDEMLTAFAVQQNLTSSDDTSHKVFSSTCFCPHRFHPAKAWTSPDFTSKSTLSFGDGTPWKCSFG